MCTKWRVLAGCRARIGNGICQWRLDRRLLGAGLQDAPVATLAQKGVDGPIAATGLSQLQSKYLPLALPRIPAGDTAGYS